MVALGVLFFLVLAARGAPKLKSVAVDRDNDFPPIINSSDQEDLLNNVGGNDTSDEEEARQQRYFGRSDRGVLYYFCPSLNTSPA